MDTSIKQRQEKEYLTVRIESQIKQQLQQIADGDQRSLSNVVTMILKSAVQKDQKRG